MIDSLTPLCLDLIQNFVFPTYNIISNEIVRYAEDDIVKIQLIFTLD